MHVFYIYCIVFMVSVALFSVRSVADFGLIQGLYVNMFYLTIIIFLGGCYSSLLVLGILS
jgi:hypothetical protein